jgi:hypothetical protein
MNTFKLLSLEIFSHQRGTTVANVFWALERIQAARVTVETAICAPGSPQRKALENMGFGAIVLTGPTGQEAVVCFDKGHKIGVSESGKGLYREGEKGFENLFDMLTWLLKAETYVTWACRVTVASSSNTRPPVFDELVCGDVDPVVRTWIGMPAEAYLEVWKMERRGVLAAAAAAAEVIPQFLPQEPVDSLGQFV